MSPVQSVRQKSPAGIKKAALSHSEGAEDGPARGNSWGSFQGAEVTWISQLLNPKRKLSALRARDSQP